MSEPQWDSTGEPLNEAARAQVAAQQVTAAQREVALEPEPENLPEGSWRRKLRDWEPDTATMVWDGEEWEIPAQMPNEYYEAVTSGDARGMVQAILGIQGLGKLRIPRDVSAELMGDLAAEVSEAAGRVWDVPNLNRSARRSRSTTRR